VHSNSSNVSILFGVRHHCDHSVRPLRIVQVIASINEATGGTAVSVTGLAASLARQGERSSIVALDYPRLGPLRPAGPAEVHLQPASFLARHCGGFSPAFLRLLARVARDADIVHNHGLWLFPNRYARIAAERAGVALVTSPRGMLEPWSRNRARLKKLIAWQLYESANVRGATAFHATSDEEARSIRACGVRAPIAVIPNGVGAPTSLTGARAAELRASLPGVGQKRYVLFLSRLHPKKGLELLLDAWRLIHDELRDVHLLIAGSDRTGYRATLEAKARDLGISDSVTFAGWIDGDLKGAAFANAEVFVLPSFSENFGTVVAEALSHGLPVITTTATPWKELAERRCGWCIDIGVAPLARSLREALTLSSHDRAEFAERGRALVRDRFSWERIASDMVTFYRWVSCERCRAAAAPTFLAE